MAGNKNIWTVEMAEDLKGFHSIDAEKELTELLNKEILDAITGHANAIAESNGNFKHKNPIDRIYEQIEADFNFRNVFNIVRKKE